MSNMKKESRVVVITGGGSGIGREAARRFAKNKDTVYIIGRDLDKLQETAQGFEAIYPVVADVTNIDALNNAKKEIGLQHRTIDVLVNNAGGTSSAKITNPTAEQALGIWNEVVNTNLTSVFLVTQLFDDVLSRPGARIINITSVAALAGSSLGGINGQAYSAAKSGIHGLSRTLMKKYAPEGITINCVAPGVIDHTGFFGGDGVPDDRKLKSIASIPEGRLGAPDEVAEAIFYLAAENSGFINGEILNINGGAQFGR